MQDQEGIAPEAAAASTAGDEDDDCVNCALLVESGSSARG